MCSTWFSSAVLYHTPVLCGLLYSAGHCQSLLMYSTWFSSAVLHHTILLSDMLCCTQSHIANHCWCVLHDSALPCSTILYSCLPCCAVLSPISADVLYMIQLCCTAPYCTLVWYAVLYSVPHCQSLLMCSTWFSSAVLYHTVLMSAVLYLVQSLLMCSTWFSSAVLYHTVLLSAVLYLVQSLLMCSTWFSSAVLYHTVLLSAVLYSVLSPTLPITAMSSTWFSSAMLSHTVLLSAMLCCTQSNDCWCVYCTGTTRKQSLEHIKGERPRIRKNLLHTHPDNLAWFPPPLQTPSDQDKSSPCVGNIFTSFPLLAVLNGKDIRQGRTIYACLCA